ncbi:MAG: aspartate dehydrogenase [Lachnospiraceae bacterium]|nr:aspartate dehydrogenase [Lachnospiraceae bacterium]
MFKLFSKKSTQRPAYDYNPEKEKPIIRASICNGEQVAGFKNLETGEFHEVMLIRDSSDLAEFKQVYGLEKVDKEY